MRFIGILISLAVVGYVIYLYLGSAPEETNRPEQTIEQARESVDALNQSLQKQKEKLDNSN